jgi:hypothetical protein
MRNVCQRDLHLRYGALAALVVALGLAAHPGAAGQPQTAGGAAPGKLPDVLGTTTGMPIQQAMDLMKAHDPGHNVIIRQWLIPQAFGDKPVTYQISTATTGEDDTLEVDVTLPPQPQMVWQIQRVIGGQNRFTSTLANVDKGLYQKYGMPWNPNPPLPLNPKGLQWFFTEQGRALNPTARPDIDALKACQNTVMQPWAILAPGTGGTEESGKAVQVYHVPPRGGIVKMPPAFDPAKNPECNNLIYVQTGIDGSDDDMRFAVHFSIDDYPLQHRTAQALNDMLNAVVQRGIQQQRDADSKRPLPKL